MTLWILPKNERNALRVVSWVRFVRFFGRIDDTLICLRDLVTFKTSWTSLCWLLLWCDPRLWKSCKWGTPSPVIDGFRLIPLEPKFLLKRNIPLLQWLRSAGGCVKLGGINVFSRAVKGWKISFGVLMKWKVINFLEVWTRADVRQWMNCSTIYHNVTGTKSIS